MCDLVFTGLTDVGSRPCELISKLANMVALMYAVSRKENVLYQIDAS